MKVGVHVLDLLPDAGGGHTFERDILENLILLAPNCRHQFTLFSHRFSGELLEFLKTSSHIDLVNTENAAPFSMRVVRKINKVFAGRSHYLSDLGFAVEKAGIDVLWFVTPVYHPVNIPYIATIWDLQHRLQPWFPEVGTLREWSYREDFYSKMIRRASYVITGTQTGAEEISFFYQVRKDRIRVLPHPTPAFAVKGGESDVQPVLEKNNLSPGFLLYPAQFWPHKNHANLLYALKILQERFDVSMDLVLIGSDKGNRSYIQQLAKALQIENQVHILGFVSRHELMALYRNAFALVYVTFFGPENLPPLEALAAGCPVIASAVSGSEEQLRDVAILVDPNRPEDMAKAVKELWDDSYKRADLIRRGRTHALRWTGKDFVQGIFNVLDEFEPVRRSWKQND